MKTHFISLRVVSALTGAAILSFFPQASAATLTWDSDGTTTTAQTDGAGAWDTATQLRWWDGSTNVDWTSGDSAIFGNGGAGGAVTLTGPTTAGSLTFNYFTGTYTLGTISQILTLNDGITMNAGSGAVTFISPIKLGAAQTWINNTNNVLTVNDGTNSVIDTNGFTLTFKGNGPNQGKFNVARGNGITGSGGIVVDNAYLDLRTGGAQSTNNYTGTTTLQNGAGILHNGSNIGTGNIILNGGVLDGYFNSGFTRGLGTGNNQIQITGGVSGFGTNGSATINFSNVTEVQWGTASFNPTALQLGTAGSSAGTTTFAEGIDLNGANRTITTLSTVNAGAVSGVIRNTSGTPAGLIKIGAGQLILSNANTYNGATTINGGTLTLSTTGTLASTSALNLSGGGILQLTNTAQVNRFADGAAIVSNGGGITYTNTSGANVYTETVGSLTASGGQTNIVLTTNQASTGSQTLTLGGLSQSGTGSVTFSAATTGPQITGNKNMFVVTGAGTTTAGEIIGSWATIGTTAALQTDYAVFNADYVTGANIAASSESTWSTTHALGSNYTLANASGSAIDGRFSATRNINSLRNTTAAGGAITVNTTTDFVTMAGNTFANGDVIVLGTTAGGLTAGVLYFVRDYNGDAANGFKLTTSSGGTAIDITAANTGTLTAGITLGTNNLGTNGILNGSSTPLVIGGNGGVVTLPTTSAGQLTINTGSGNITINAPITNNTGALTLVKNGSANLTLNGINTFTGNLAINAGTLQIGTNGTANGANLNSGNYAGDIFIGAGANLDYQSNSTQILSGIISGDGNLLQRYSGTLTLGDDNTYTGKTTIGAITNTAGATLVVSSFNSVNGGTPLLANSSLGAPTTVANGTIEMGSNNSGPTQTLRYAGVAATGETTDRVINFIFNGSAQRTLDASGSGLLKFTSPFTSTGLSSGVLNLTGTGNGELAGLPFLFGTLNKSGAGTWTLSGQSGHTTATTISANGGTLQIAGTGSFLGGSYAGTIAIGASGTLQYSSSANQSFRGVISGAGALTKDTSSTSILRLTAANTYTGSTTVNAGKLTIASTGSINGTSGVSIGAGEFNYNSSTALTKAVSFSGTGGTLSGSSTINLAVNVTTGNTLAIGANANTVGVMNFGNNLTVAGTYLFDLNNTNDTADLGDVTGNLTLGGILDLVQLGAYAAGDKFTLFAYDGALTGIFTGIADDTNFTDAGGLWTMNYNDTTAGLNGGASVSNTFVTITAIPEPKAALLGALGLLLLLRRRR